MGTGAAANTLEKHERCAKANATVHQYSRSLRCPVNFNGRPGISMEHEVPQHEENPDLSESSWRVSSIELGRGPPRQAPEGAIKRIQRVVCALKRGELAANDRQAADPPQPPTSSGTARRRLCWCPA
ncbi:MAG: hypothetical protein Q9219_001063 [cf. Caloplaca sp. 3 TL-2023]